MLEGKWNSVPPQLFTATGGLQGQIQVADTAGFRVKMCCAITLPGSPPALAPLPVQIKRVLSKTQLIVGQIDNKVYQWGQIDLSGYTVLMGTMISAEFQNKNPIPPDDHYKAIYDSDPVVADRVIQVDKYGNYYDDNNPMPISFDGTVQIGDVSIVYEGNTMKVNSDGSINVVVEPIPSTSLLSVSKYNELVALAGGSTSFIVSYTVPVGKQAIFQKAVFSGENIARYDLFIDGVIQDTARTAYGGDYTGEFNWTSGNESGLLLSAGDTIQVQVYNFRPSAATFEARIQVLEITV